MTFRIGIISDTHGLLRPEAERGLTGVNHIIHAGDIGRPEIVDALRRIAPVDVRLICGPILQKSLRRGMSVLYGERSRAAPRSDSPDNKGAGVGYR
jgi:predicted phosphodiesterase